MVQTLAVIQVLLSMALCALILLHSGRDAGFGGMGYTPASQGGTHIVERNLTRLTVVVAILFVANCVAVFLLLRYESRFSPPADDRSRAPPSVAVPVRRPRRTVLAH